MYLGGLNGEQKKLFLDLCIHGANSNDDFADDEKEMVREYCAEMQIPVRYTEENGLDECIDKLVQISSREEIRAILIEITALILADDICDEQEEVFMQKFIKKAEISNDEYKHVSEMLSSLSGIYRSLNEFVEGD